MIPTILVGWLWVVPLTARFAETGLFGLLGEIVVPVLRALAAGLAVLAALIWFAPFPPDGGFIDCVWRGALVVLPVAALGRSTFKALRSSG